MATDSKGAAIATPAPGQVAISGTLTVSTVAGLVRESRRFVDAQQGGRVEVDLSGVDHADSAGLALLVGWIADARARGVAIAFRGVPQRLHAIAKISEVDDLLTGPAASA